MLDINLTLPIVLLMFLVFAVLMNIVFFGPVVRVLDARRELIDGRKRRAQEAGSRAQVLEVQLAAGLASAKHRASETLAEALKLAETQKQALVAETALQVSAEVEEALREIGAEKERLLAGLQDEVSALSDEIRFRALGASPALVGSGVSVGLE
jgi:F-type H+-transporting ATPase subunit b